MAPALFPKNFKIMTSLERFLIAGRHATCAMSKPCRARGGRLLSKLYRITVDPEQSGGRPSIRCLRIRVKDVLDLLASGASGKEILEDYPHLEDADISAVLEYAARQCDHPVLHVA
jgi:uncharacterized protein (DUF433 family)